MNRYKSLIKYELMIILRGGFVLGFALILPCVLLALIGRGVIGDVPQAYKQSVFASIFVGFSTLIVLAGVFLGHSANYSREYENGVPQRLNLFGISSGKIIISKLISQILFVFLAFLIYWGFATIIGVKIEKFIVIVSMMILLLLQVFPQFLLAHSFVVIFKKFGLTYAVSMFFYFMFMIVSGNMGIDIDRLPKFMQFIGEKLLPFVEFQKFNLNILQGKALDWKSLILSNLYFFIIVALVFAFSRIRNRKAV